MLPQRGALPLDIEHAVRLLRAERAALAAGLRAVQCPVGPVDVRRVEVAAKRVEPCSLTRGRVDRCAVVVLRAELAHPDGSRVRLALDEEIAPPSAELVGELLVRRAGLVEPRIVVNR